MTNYDEGGVKEEESEQEEQEQERKLYEPKSVNKKPPKDHLQGIYRKKDNTNYKNNYHKKKTTLPRLILQHNHKYHHNKK